MLRFENVFDLEQNEQMIRDRRYGIIEVQDGRFHRIRFRPWPKTVSLPEVWWDSRVSRGSESDLCKLYYNQPIGSSNFLALKYVVSSFGATFATVRQAALVLDEVARIKQTDAIVCEASNHRISDRLLRRWGWEPHLLHRRRRHFIKRFYGTYPAPPPPNAAARRVSACKNEKDSLHE